VSNPGDTVTFFFNPGLVLDNLASAKLGLKARIARGLNPADHLPPSIQAVIAIQATDTNGEVTTAGLPLILSAVGSR
jgi:hypothetical protein